MKVAPVSADLLVKLALGAALVGGAWWAITRARSAAGDALAGAASAAWDTVGDAAWALSPTNQNNVIYQTVNAGIGSVYTGDVGRNADDSWSLGGAIFDIFNPDTAAAVRDIEKPVFTGGASGSW